MLLHNAYILVLLFLSSGNIALGWRFDVPHIILTCARNIALVDLGGWSADGSSVHQHTAPLMDERCNNHIVVDFRAWGEGYGRELEKDGEDLRSLRGSTVV